MQEWVKYFREKPGLVTDYAKEVRRCRTKAVSRRLRENKYDWLHKGEYIPPEPEIVQPEPPPPPPPPEGEKTLGRKKVVLTPGRSKPNGPERKPSNTWTKVREGHYERATGPPMEVPPGVTVVPIHDTEDIKTSKKAPMGLMPGSRRAKRVEGDTEAKRKKKMPLRFVDVTSLGNGMQIVKVRKKTSIRKAAAKLASTAPGKRARVVLKTPRGKKYARTAAPGNEDHLVKV
jgi:hypothetical protein